MHTLMGLPNEILESIIDATGPEDIESFSTCCKLLYSLARHRLEEHKGKKSLFSKLLVDDYFLPLQESLRGAKCGNCDAYLKDFFSDQRNNLYPKAVVVYFSREQGVSHDGLYGGSLTARTSAINGLNELEQQLKSRMAEVHSMIALDVGRTEADDWGKDIRAGYPLATFLLLLALLPNLEKCEIEILEDSSQISNANYSKIIRLMIEAALGRKENGLSFGGRLSECTVDGSGFEGIVENLLPFIMMLPRMKTIEGSGLKIENGPWPFTDAVSPVVDLNLLGGIDTVTLSNYVRGIRELKRFRYTYIDIGIEWNPCRIVAALREFAFRSLVSLDLTTEKPLEDIWLDVSPYIGSLRSFEVLETIRLHFMMLFEEVGTADGADPVNPVLRTLEDLLHMPLVKGQNLIDFLPPSVRIFELWHDGMEELVGVGELVLDTFEGFTEHRKERLPNLELIYLDPVGEFNSQIAKICKEAGVQMESSWQGWQANISCKLEAGSKQVLTA